MANDDEFFVPKRETARQIHRPKLDLLDDYDDYDDYGYEDEDYDGPYQNRHHQDKRQIHSPSHQPYQSGPHVGTEGSGYARRQAELWDDYYEDVSHKTRQKQRQELKAAYEADLWRQEQADR